MRTAPEILWHVFKYLSNTNTKKECAIKLLEYFATFELGYYDLVDNDFLLFCEDIGLTKKDIEKYLGIH